MRSPVSQLIKEKGAEVHSIEPDATVAEAVRQMGDAKIGALLVAEGESIVGIFTERDVLRRVVAESRDPVSTKVRDVMTRSVIQVRPTTLVEEAMAIMTEKRCRHLPIMEGGKVIGLVSIGDLTRWLVRGQKVEIQGLVEYIQGRYPG